MVSVRADEAATPDRGSGLAGIAGSYPWTRLTTVKPPAEIVTLSK